MTNPVFCVIIDMKWRCGMDFIFELLLELIGAAVKPLKDKETPLIEKIIIGFLFILPAAVVIILIVLYT